MSATQRGEHSKVSSAGVASDHHETAESKRHHYKYCERAGGLELLRRKLINYILFYFKLSRGYCIYLYQHYLLIGWSLIRCTQHTLKYSGLPRQPRQQFSAIVFKFDFFLQKNFKFEFFLTCAS